MPERLRVSISQRQATGVREGKMGEVFLALDMREVMVPLA